MCTSLENDYFAKKALIIIWHSVIKSMSGVAQIECWPLIGEPLSEEMFFERYVGLKNRGFPYSYKLGISYSSVFQPFEVHGTL